VNWSEPTHERECTEQHTGHGTARSTRNPVPIGGDKQARGTVTGIHAAYLPNTHAGARAAWLGAPVVAPLEPSPGAPRPLPVPQDEVEPIDQPEATSWHLPGIPIDLPTPSHVVDGGGDLIEQWHPRSPDLRVGRAQDRPSPTSEGDASDERTGLAKAAMVAGMGGGLVLNAVDLARLAKKFPEALRAARFDPSLGRLGRLPTALALAAQVRVDDRIVNPLAPRVASAASLGRSFTRFDELAMRTSVLLGASLAAVQVASAIPNIIDAVGKDGPWHENLLQTTAGRFGMLQLGGGLLAGGIFATALARTHAAAGGAGLVQHVMAASKSPIMAKPIVGQIGIAAGLITAANELGYLDMLNSGETRSIGQVLGDAARGTPVLSDPTLRTGVLLGAGAVTGFKLHRAMTAGGGIGALSKGHWAAAGIVGGLLGAQLLGRLGALDS
jgi:hypothetical protein